MQIYSVFGCGGMNLTADHEVRSKFTGAWPESPCAVAQVYTSPCFIADHNSGPCGSHPEVSACFTTLSGLAQRLDGRALMMKVTAQDSRSGKRQKAGGCWLGSSAPSSRLGLEPERADCCTLSSFSSKKNPRFQREDQYSESAMKMYDC